MSDVAATVGRGIVSFIVRHEICRCVLPAADGSDISFVTVFFRTHKNLEAVDPQFTMRRKMEQLREELELTEHLREVL